VDWNGATRSWQWPPVNHQWLSRVVAELLPDGRIALLFNDKGLSMTLLGDEGRFVTFTLRNLRVHEFDAAIDGAGRIAVVAARNDSGVIDAAVIDAAHPDHAEWRSRAGFPYRSRDLHSWAGSRGALRQSRAHGACCFAPMMM